MGDYPERPIVLYEKNFGYVAFWEFNPEVLGSLWLIASMTLAGGGGGGGKNHFA
jgi:hypothetical protein